jgi:osmotically inducible protein OsmC
MATRNGEATWNGDLMHGSGQLTVGENRWTTDYSFTSRFKGVLTDADEDATNPEELVAAAHAACFSMALSLALTENGHPPRLIDTHTRVHLRNVAGLPTIQEIDLDTEADVPNIEETDFQKTAQGAKTSCIISRALTGVEAINLSATLRR